MIKNTTLNHEPLHKMASIMKNVTILSLAVNIFEIYNFFRETGDVRQIISIILGIGGTLLIWLLSRALGQSQKQALYFWLGACFLGYIRWIFIDATFQPGILSLILIALTLFFTVRIAIWVKNGLLS